MVKRLTSFSRAGMVLALSAVVGACSPDATGSAALSRAAEVAAAQGPDATPPYQMRMLERLRACSLASFTDAMSERAPKRRAAGAMCASELPCNEAAVDQWLARLAADEAVVLEVHDRGPLFGSGDRRVRTPVSYYAQYAIDDRRMNCPAR